MSTYILYLIINYKLSYFILCYEHYEGCLTCCCPRLTFGRNVEIIDQGRTCEYIKLQYFNI